jgi:membrane peptidoglycan carboxypeptidase
MMNAVVTSGTGQRSFLGFTPQAGKTGTNQGYRDAWYIGFTANNVTGVWFGNDDFTPMKELTGGKLPAATWKLIMLEAERSKAPAALAGLPLEESYLRFAAQNAETLQPGSTTPPGVETLAVATSPTAVDAAPAAPDAQSMPEATTIINDPPIVIRPPVRAEERKQAPRKPARAKKQRLAEIEDGEAPQPRIKIIRQRRIVDTEVDVDAEPERRERRDPVVQVLRDMFGVSDREPERPRAKRKNRDIGLFLPEPNTRRKKRNREGFFERLRKKPLFDF